MPSAKILSEKQAYVADLKAKFESAVSGCVVAYGGINVENDTPFNIVRAGGRRAAVDSGDYSENRDKHIYEEHQFETDFTFGEKPFKKIHQQRQYDNDCTGCGECYDSKPGARQCENQLCEHGEEHGENQQTRNP